jgi:long-chain acyl-CoA synthetase
MVPSYQRLNDYAITETALPRTNLGKIQRHTLTKYYRQAKAGELEADAAAEHPIAVVDMNERDQALLAAPVVRKTWDWLAERYHDRKLTPDTSPQLDLGVDSMDWMTLTLELSELTGVELSDDAIGRVNSVRDLLNEVQQAAESGTADAGPRINLAQPDELLTDEQRKWLQPRWLIFEILAAVIFFPLRLVARLYFNLTAFGRENLPRRGNYILTPNHRSFLDAPMLAAVLPYRLTRQFYWAAAVNTLFHNPVSRSISWIFQAIPIEHQRSGAGLKNLAIAAEVLQRDKNLVWFPEGNITRSGDMLPFQEGIGIVLQAMPTPVIPVYIEGTREALPRGESLPRPYPISITFGEPLDPRQLAEEGEGDTVPARITNALQKHVRALGEPEAVQPVFPAPASPEPASSAAGETAVAVPPTPAPAPASKRQTQRLAYTSLVEGVIIVLTMGLAWWLWRRGDDS